MGIEGGVVDPIDIVFEFTKNTPTWSNEDGFFRHSYCLISPAPNTELFYSQEVPSFVISEFC
jgi:hypothetical protein